MYQKIKAYVEKNHMLKEKDKVIVGVSGGADSVCLLFMLIELQKELEIQIIAVHVHHGLRGEEADRDAEYVKKICAEHGIELLLYYENVQEFAKLHKMGEEEAGREIRRKIFEQVRKEKKADKVALAHHQNDSVETLLWNLCRGTGLQGLGGIAPVNEEKIRPLLCVKRSEIESYLEGRGLEYCTDHTNASDQYTRNRIRNHLIPYMEEAINDQTVSHIFETMEQMRKINEYIQEETAAYLKKCVLSVKGKKVLLKEEFAKVPDALKPHLLKEILYEITGKRKDIESIHLKIAEDLLEKQVGRKCQFPDEVCGLRTYLGVQFQKGEDSEEEEVLEVSMRVFEKSLDMTTFPRNPYTKWFDYDIIKNSVEMRHRAPGDIIVIDKDGRSQKLKQYFINEKISQSERERIWVFADGQQIMWIVGHRQSHAYQITDKTKNILEINIHGGKE